MNPPGSAARIRNVRKFSCRILPGGAYSHTMRTPFRILVMLCAWFGAAQMVTGQTSAWVADYNRLLGKYATSAGVKYGVWKSNAADMHFITIR